MIKNIEKSSFLLFAIILYGLGLVQVLSSSYMFSLEKYGNGYYIFFKQLIYICLGLGVIFIYLRLNQEKLLKWAWLLWPLVTILMILTLIPGLGIKSGGAQRWLSLGWGLRFEPSEFLKLAFCFWLPSLFFLKDNQIFLNLKLSWKFILSLIPFVVLLIQPDFGAVVVCALLLLSFLIFKGIKMQGVFFVLGNLMIILIGLILIAPYRKQRIISFLDPWQDSQGSGYQMIQSMATFSRGGFWGEGPGRSQGKLFFLPESHTDFTFAIFAEEWGFLGVLILIGFYMLIYWQGIKLVTKIKNNLEQAVVFMMVHLMAISVIVNMGVVLGLLPTKGLTLPFLSYGGSSLLALSFLFAFLIKSEIQLYS